MKAFLLILFFAPVSPAFAAEYACSCTNEATGSAEDGEQKTGFGYFIAESLE